MRSGIVWCADWVCPGYGTAKNTNPDEKINLEEILAKLNNINYFNSPTPDWLRCKKLVVDLFW
jgi:hypothetical protein